MAKKREGGMPSSPLAAKLVAEVVNHRTAVKPAKTKARTAPPPQSNEPKEKPTVTTTLKTKPAKKPSRTRKDNETRVMLDAEEMAMRDEVVSALRQLTGEKVEYSHLMRSLLSLVAGAMPSIEANASHASLPERPANNDLMGVASFEDELGKFLLIALRDKKAMDAD